MRWVYAGWVSAKMIQIKALRDWTTLKLQKQMFDEQNKLNAPFRENGLTGQNRLMDLLGLSENKGQAGYGSAAKNFGMSDFNADPGYQFRVSEGEKAIDRAARARGLYNSGGTMKALDRYLTSLAARFKPLAPVGGTMCAASPAKNIRPKRMGSVTKLRKGAMLFSMLGPVTRCSRASGSRR